MDQGFALARDGARAAAPGVGRPFFARRRAALAVWLAAALFAVAPGLARAANLKVAPADPIDQAEPKKDKKVDPTAQQRKMFEATEIKQPANFDECVRVALTQSPNLLRSSLEIEVKKLDEGDTLSQYIPTLQIGTTYYLRNPNEDIINPSPGQAAQKPYTFTFSAGGWNPVQTYFDNKAKEGLTKIAVETHLEAINQGLKEIATLFLQIGYAQKNLDLVAQRLELAKQNLQYVQTRVSLGYAKPLDLDIAKTRVDMAVAEGNKYEGTKATLVNTLKSIIGVQPSQKLDLDMGEFAEQIMRGYAPAMATPEKAKEASFDLRKAEIQKELQRKSITLAYVKYLPQIGFSISTPDPVNQSSGTRWGVYPALSLTLPMDFLTKTRDVSRQKFLYEQASTTTLVTGLKIENVLLTALANYRSLDAAMHFSKSKVDLAKLTEQQTQLEYQGSQSGESGGSDKSAGKVDYDKLLLDRLSLLDAKQMQLVDEYKRDEALLELKFISGDLRRQYVNVTPVDVAHTENSQ